jgi:membrane-bound ClpP family serine protease
MIMPPGKMGIAMFLTKPETYLSIAMFLLFSDLIRVEIFIICILFNLWGIAVFLFNTRKLIIPYTYERFRGDVIEAGISENKIKAWDKMSGYKEN